MGPEIDRMCQFLGQETDIMGEIHYIVSFESEEPFWLIDILSY